MSKVNETNKAEQQAVDQIVNTFSKLAEKLDIKKPGVEDFKAAITQASKGYDTKTPFQRDVARKDLLAAASEFCNNTKAQDKLKTRVKDIIEKSENLFKEPQNEAKKEALIKAGESKSITKTLKKMAINTKEKITDRAKELEGKGRRAINKLRRKPNYKSL